MKNTKQVNKQKIERTPEEKIERDKIFLLGAGVCFFMSLIFVLWIFSLNNFWQEEKETKETEMQSFWQKHFSEWDSLGSQLNNNLETVKQGIKKLTEEGKSAEKESLEQKKWEELKNKLELEAEQNNN